MGDVLRFPSERVRARGGCTLCLGTGEMPVRGFNCAGEVRIMGSNPCLCRLPDPFGQRKGKA